MAAKGLHVLAAASLTATSTAVYTVAAGVQARIPAGGITIANTTTVTRHVTLSAQIADTPHQILSRLILPPRVTYVHPGQLTLAAAEKLVAVLEAGETGVTIIVSGYELDAV